MRVLQRPWFPADLGIQRADALVWAPAAFRKHGVYLSARTALASSWPGQLSGTTVSIGCTFRPGAPTRTMLENLDSVTGKVHSSRPIHRSQALLSAAPRWPWLTMQLA